MQGKTDFLESQLTSEEIYDGVIVHLYRDTVRLPTGRTSVREVARHPGAVCVLPLDDEGRACMVRQFRYPYACTLLEAPAGKLEPGEAPLDGAKRELSEETGVSAAEWIPLGTYYPAPAASNEVIHLYLARDLTRGSAHPDEDEFLATERVSLAKLLECVMQGELCDGKTQVILLKAALYLQKERA